MIAMAASARISAALLLAALLPRVCNAATGAWIVEADQSPLTDLPAATATLSSAKPLSNMIGADERATLVLRCRDRVLAAYVAWPEVLSHDMDNVIGEPKTQAHWRLDNGAIGTGLWTISSDGVAAGAFASGAALKLVAAWRHARRLVVRLTGRTVQDAIFELDGIDAAAGEVLTACGTGGAQQPGQARLAPTFDEGVTVATSLSAAAVLFQARHALEETGFTIESSDEGAGVIISAAREMPLTTKQANCGSLLGIPYLADRRAHTTVAYRLAGSEGRVTVGAMIGGIYKGGFGARDKTLQCTSTGALERALLDKLVVTSP